MGSNRRLEAPTFSVESVGDELAKMELTANISYTGFGKNLLILNFGEKERKGKLKQGLLFTNNKGFDEMEIVAISSSCGCTQPTFRKEGDAYLVQVGVDMTRMVKGVNEKYVTITLENKKTIKIKIKVDGL